MTQLSAQDKTTAQALAVVLAKPFEGFSSTPYVDPDGVWTIGYGATYDMNNQRVTADTPPITEEQGTILLGGDMAVACMQLQGACLVPLNVNQAAALIDFIYNEGIGHFRSSTLLRLLNAGDYEGAGEQLLVWDIGDGRVLDGLENRRKAELALWNTLPDDGSGTT